MSKILRTLPSRLALLGGVLFLNLVSLNTQLECYKAPSSKPKKVFLASVPKGGTNLVKKAFSLLGITLHSLNRPPFNGPITDGQECRVFPDSNFVKSCFSRVRAISSHAIYTQELAESLQGDEYCIILNIRDPRAFFYSWSRWLHRPESRFAQARRTSVEEIMLDTLTDGTLSVRDDGFRWPAADGIDQMYRAYLAWTKQPNCVLICYEDLVGPHGGGTLEAQIATLTIIANAVGLEKSEQELIAIAKKLYGGTTTFDKGKIDSWKKVIVGKMKELFKEKCGQLLIDMGYESDFDW